MNFFVFNILIKDIKTFSIPGRLVVSRIRRIDERKSQMAILTFRNRAEARRAKKSVKKIRGYNIRKEYVHVSSRARGRDRLR